MQHRSGRHQLASDETSCERMRLIFWSLDRQGLRHQTGTEGCLSEKGRGDGCILDRQANESHKVLKRGGALMEQAEHPLYRAGACTPYTLLWERLNSAYACVPTVQAPAS